MRKRFEDLDWTGLGWLAKKVDQTINTISSVSFRRNIEEEKKERQRKVLEKEKGGTRRGDTTSPHSGSGQKIKDGNISAGEVGCNFGEKDPGHPH